MGKTPERDEGTPEDILRELMPPQGLDKVFDILTNPDEIDDAPFPVTVRSYYDSKTEAIRNELDGRGIGYTDSLIHIDGIERITEEDYQRALEPSQPPSNHVIYERRLDMGISLEVLQVGEETFLKTDLTPNEHGITSTGPKFYRLNPNNLPSAYRTEYPNPDIERIAGFNIGMAKPYAIVDLINR